MGLAQAPNSKLSAGAVNEKYLEHLIKVKIDSVREAHQLPILINDSILYVAAKYHANWMNRNRKFSHYEREVANRETPQERVMFFGGETYQVGENIIKSYVGKLIEPKKGRKYINESYEDLANDFVEGWVNSPGHYKNIITKDYQLTGVAVSINEKKSLVYAVQKFAWIPGVYAFQENKNMFAYSDWVASEPISSFDQVEKIPFNHKKRFAWKIRSPKDSIKRCSEVNNAINYARFRDYLRPKGKYIVFKSFNIDMMESIIQKRRDGLAVEFVHFNPYGCGNDRYFTDPTRRNGNSILNDTVVQPLYKKDLKKGFKREKRKKFWRTMISGSAKNYTVKLARIPKELNGYVETNLIVLKKKRMCRVKHFTGYCGEYMADTVEAVFDTIIPYFPYERNWKERTKTFEVSFEKAKYNYTYSDISYLLEDLKHVDYTIDTAVVNTYSSVEGSKKINEKLQIRRGESIVKALSENQDEIKEYKVIPNNNWNKFTEQIESNQQLDSLKGKSEEELFTLLQDKDFVESIELFLKEQRKATVKLSLTYSAKENELDSLVKEFEIAMKVSSWLPKAKSIQYKIYELARDSIVDINALDRLIQYFKEDSWSLKENHIWYNKALGRYLKLDLLYDHMNKVKFYSEELLAQKIQVGLQLYLSGKDKIEDELIDNLGHLQRISEGEKSKKVSNLYLQVLVHLIQHHDKKDTEKGSDKVKEYCDLLFELIQYNQFPDEKKLQVAKLFIKCFKDSQAYSVLNKMRLKQTILEEVYVLHAKLSYYHNQEYSNRKYHEYLIQLHETIPNDTWCGMFIGPCNISFQVFDDVRLKQFYCEKCGDFQNYVKKLYVK